MKWTNCVTEKERQERKIALINDRKNANSKILCLLAFTLGFAAITDSAYHSWDSDLFTVGVFIMIFAVLCFFGRHVEVDPEEYADYPDFDEEEYERYEQALNDDDD